MKFERQFTKKGNDAYAGMEFKTTTSEIKNPDGTIVFSAPNIEVPANYSNEWACFISCKEINKLSISLLIHVSVLLIVAQDLITSGKALFIVIVKGLFLTKRKRLFEIWKLNIGITALNSGSTKKTFLFFLLSDIGNIPRIYALISWSGVIILLSKVLEYKY